MAIAELPLQSLNGKYLGARREPCAFRGQPDSYFEDRRGTVYLSYKAILWKGASREPIFDRSFRCITEPTNRTPPALPSCPGQPKAEHQQQELSEDISICLFRILQKAVQNAAKHSGSRHFQVLLRSRSNQIGLTIHDSGIGFDPEKALHREGIGLTSMRERMKLINGDLSIESDCSAEQRSALGSPAVHKRRQSAT